MQITKSRKRINPNIPPDGKYRAEWHKKNMIINVGRTTYTMLVSKSSEIRQELDVEIKNGFVKPINS